MKIGILTFHNAINHGAVLQTYATQELLRGMGHQVEVIDYRNQAVEAYYDKFRFHLGVLLRKRKIRYLVSPFLFWLQRRAFSRFKNKHLRISPDGARQAGQKDLILVGSDQLWNLRITGGFDPWYWGDKRTIGLDPEKTRMATWAVCMNHTEMALGETERIDRYLKNFSALSVREKELLDLIAPLTDKPVVQTLDPTLLLDADKWRALCHKVRPSHYVAVYAIEFKDKRRVAKVAERLARKEGLGVVNLRVYADTGSLWDALHGCGPDDFLSYLNAASYVVTSSFHGTAFSMILGKQFFSVVDPERGNVRVENLLRQTGMENRKVDYDERFEQIAAIDYSQFNVGSSLKVGCLRSIDFLKELGV